MRYSLVCATILGFVSLVSTAPPKGCAHKLKESIQPPRGWVQRRPAPPNLTIDLRIALPQQNFAQLEQHLYAISDPYHERYGDHLSKEEIGELITPHPESLDRVNKWLASHGISEQELSRSPAKDWVKVRVPVSLAEKMLDTKYYVWENPKDGNSIVRTTAYSLPEDVHAHIDLVQPTTLFSTLRGMTSTLQVSQEASSQAVDGPPIKVPSAFKGLVDVNCNYKITITCLQQLYNLVGYKPSATKRNMIGVTGYLDLFASFADLQEFYASQRKDAVGTNFTVISVNSGQNDQANPGGEANLDTQFAFGLTFPTPGIFYTTGGSPPFIPDDTTPTNTNEPYLDWLEFMLKHPNPPQTISTSYADDEQTVPVSFAKRVCEGFAQLGAQGVSLIFSSGDGGVGDRNPDPATQQCFTNDGKNKTAFIPLFPPSCPFVTSVGGTTGVPETSAFFSGGGFSNLFPRPSFQDKAIPQFLEKLPKGTYAGLFNPEGRGIPDVAAQSEKFAVVLDGIVQSAMGTSAAAPTFAAVISLLNDARLSQGKPPLGWLNPLLYKLGDRWPEALNDIVTGSNPGCGTPGFNATKGWDPVTGLGTPNFRELKKVVTECV